MKEALKLSYEETLFTIGDLKKANESAGPVEHIIMMQLIKKAVELSQDISNFINAIESK